MKSLLIFIFLFFFIEIELSLQKSLPLLNVDRDRVSSFGRFKVHPIQQQQLSVTPIAVSLPLTNIRLTPGSLFYSLESINLEYMSNLKADNFLYMFRETAGITNPSGASAYGGWEAPTCELRGHFVGHFLSATSRMWQATGDTDLKTKMDYMVNSLLQCQQKIGTGYLSAFPVSFFDRLEALQDVWAPYYTIHKIMAGLLDQYVLAQNNNALQIVIGMADYFKTRIDNVLKTKGMNYWQQILDNEWGGMNDVLFSLYQITGNQAHLQTAYYFDHYSFTAPLSSGVDELENLHANTHIPEIIGCQRGYEVTGNETLKEISQFFFDTVTKTRTYATGGNNDYEHWPAPNSLGDTTNDNSQESCTQYNMMKTARHLFEWTADESYADFYERSMWGGIIGNINHQTWGQFIYYQPLGGGSSKPWGDPFNSFWCCYGTMLESHSKLGDSVYFSSLDNSVLYINQFVSSSLSWNGINLIQDSGFPNSTTSTTKISITSGGGSVSVAIRVPQWATGKNVISLNGSPLTGPFTPGTYVYIVRTWKTGDLVEVYFPLSLWIAKINDQRQRFQKTYAILYGPVTLAGVTTDFADSYNATLVGDLENPQSWIVRDSTDELHFTAKGLDRSLTLIPLAYVVNEPYIVYFDANPAPTLKSIQATVNGQSYYVRHSGTDFYNNMLYLTPVQSGQEEGATWVVLEGLVNEKGADSLISLEAFHWSPGFYAIHNLEYVNYTLQTATAGPTPWPTLFRQQSSYWVRAGLVADSDAASQTVSFESYDQPGYFISTFDQVNPCQPSSCQNLCGYNSCLSLYIREFQNTLKFNQSSTFTLVDPLWKSTTI